MENSNSSPTIRSPLSRGHHRPCIRARRIALFSEVPILPVMWVLTGCSKDQALELEHEAFKWRWETCVLGRKTSAEILSKQLIMPLISVTHLAFSSVEPVSELPEKDLEKVVVIIPHTLRTSLTLRWPFSPLIKWGGLAEGWLTRMSSMP